MRAFPETLPSGLRYWTVLGDDLAPIREVDAYLRHLRLGRDSSELTTKSYAGSIALFLRWCECCKRERPSIWKVDSRHDRPTRSVRSANSTGGSGTIMVCSACGGEEISAVRCGNPAGNLRSGVLASVREWLVGAGRYQLLIS